MHRREFFFPKRKKRPDSVPVANSGENPDLDPITELAQQLIAEQEKQTKKPSRLDRRSFLVQAALLFGAPVVVNYCSFYFFRSRPRTPFNLNTLIANSIEEITASETTEPESLDYEELKMILEERFGLPVEVVFDDHLHPKVESTDIVMGELSHLSLTPFVSDNCEQESIWLSGLEIPSCDRQQQHVDGIYSSSLSISLDSSFGTHLDHYFETLIAYLKEQEETKYKRLAWSFTKTKRRESLNLGWSIVNLTAATGRALQNVSKQQPTSLRGFAMAGVLSGLLNSFSAAALNSLTPFPEQEYQSLEMYADHNVTLGDVFRFVPKDKAIQLRNISMVVNMNSLAGLDFEQMGDKIIMFAGSGHSDMGQLLARDPQEVEELLSQELEHIFLEIETEFESSSTLDQTALLKIASQAVAGHTVPISWRRNFHHGQVQTTFEPKPEASNYSSSSLVLMKCIHSRFELAQQNNNHELMNFYDSLIYIVAKSFEEPYWHDSIGTHDDHELNLLTPDVEEVVQQFGSLTTLTTRFGQYSKIEPLTNLGAHPDSH